MKNFPSIGHDGAQERAWLAHVLADLLDMGISLTEAVDRLRETRGRLRSTRMTQALGCISNVLRSGGHLSYAVDALPYFPRRWPLLVAQGERCGELAPALRSLAELETREPWLSPSSAARAAFCLLAIIGVGWFTAVYILPTFIALDDGLNVAIPTSTRLLHALSGLGAPTQMKLGALVSLAILMCKGCPSLWTWLVQSSGGAAATLREQGIAVRAMACALRLGLSTAQAVELAADTVSHSRYRHALLEFDPAAPLSTALARRPDLFDPLLVLTVRMAEAREALVEGLDLAAERLLERADVAARRRRELTSAWLALTVGAAATLVAAGLMSGIMSVIASFTEGVMQ